MNMLVVITGTWDIVRKRRPYRRNTEYHAVPLRAGPGRPLSPSDGRIRRPGARWVLCLY